jgi:hypothetical protein
MVHAMSDPDPVRIIKKTWRQIARTVKFKDDYTAFNCGLVTVDSEIGPLTYRYNFGWRDDTNNMWFTVDCAGILCHYGALFD